MIITINRKEIKCMPNELKYLNGELHTSKDNCFELSYTIDQIVVYGDNNIHTLYFYSNDIGYHIHYHIELGKVEAIYCGDNVIHEKAINYYWNDYTIRNLQRDLDNCMDYDENIRYILSLMDDFSNMFGGKTDIEIMKMIESEN